MSEYITHNFRGTTVTIGITGLPVTITGEVLSSYDDDIVELRLQNGNIVTINTNAIAFVI